MGSGKTTVGRLLAEALGVPLVDSDQQVEARTGRTVQQIFATDGEPAYRRLEAEALAEALACTERTVVAAAGGVVLDPENRARLQRAGTVVWLHAHPAELVRRVAASGDEHRPLLEDDPEGTLRRLDAEREPLYAEVADTIVEVGGKTPRQVADEILAAVSVVVAP